MDIGRKHLPEGLLDLVRTRPDWLDGAPVAIVVPTTPRTVGLATRMRAVQGFALVGDGSLAPSRAPAQILRQLRDGVGRPDLVVFTDQIVGAADASILVRSTSGDRYFSPLELILCAEYGYALAVWTGAGDRRIAPGTQDITIVMSALASHLDSADALGAAWLARSMQEGRTPRGRRIFAQRKLRFFKAAVINAYRDAPDDPAAEKMMERIDALEATIGVAAP